MSKIQSSGRRVAGAMSWGRAWLGACALTAAGLAGAAPDVCEHRSRGWSEMRSILADVARFRGKTEGNVQKLIGQALAGDGDAAAVGEFEIHYGRGRTGEPPPNDAVCLPRRVSFAVRAGEAAYACKAAMSEKGVVQSLSCVLAAG